LENKIFIAVIGTSKANAKEAKLAEEVGRKLAERGAIVVCGGLGGVMEAVCRGAKSAGGLTVGILPSHNRLDANPYVDIPILTGMGYTRNPVVVRSGQAVIAVGGQYGTLSELAYALQEKIPVIGLGTWKLATAKAEDKSIIIAKNATDAVNKAIDSIK
jgi:uncharacterized protein (TIGR00725 family)